MRFSRWWELESGFVYEFSNPEIELQLLPQGEESILWQWVDSETGDVFSSQIKTKEKVSRELAERFKYDCLPRLYCC
jgi:hypothetical protein